MGKFVTLKTELNELRQIDPRLVSYNVEMTEVTGGTFWKAYTDAQVDGTEEFPVIKDWSNMGNLQQWYDPIDTTNPRLIKLAKELGTAWVRVSGTWANKTYYDFDGHTNGQVPEGYQNVLTKDQWTNLLDFVKAVDGKLLVSFANCPGNHSKDEPWDTTQAKMLMDYSIEHGVPVAAAEFTNEPNLIALSGLPQGYTAADHARDHDAFGAWLKENYPDCLFVGPCTVGDIDMLGVGMDGAGGGMAAGFEMVTTEQLLGEYKSKMDVFSYHYYNGVSERLASVMPSGHWSAAEATSEAYLDTALRFARTYVPFRDKYVPGAEMWVTESGDAGGGGDTWASTFLDVFRTLNELGGFAAITNGVIFHNTLASSDYGFLAREVFDPRPNYFAVLLWNRLMGTTVYDSGEEIREGAHVYVHSRKDGKEGKVYLIINNSTTEATTVEIPTDAERYTLAGKDGNIRATVMTLNGEPLVLGENNAVPELKPVAQPAGTIELAPATCTFLVL